VSLEGLDVIGTGPLQMLCNAVEVDVSVIFGVLEGNPHGIQDSLCRCVAIFLSSRVVCIDLRDSFMYPI
jgi:hypothetical protein